MNKRLTAGLAVTSALAGAVIGSIAITPPSAVYCPCWSWPERLRRYVTCLHRGHQWVDMDSGPGGSTLFAGIHIYACKRCHYGIKIKECDGHPQVAREAVGAD